MSNWISGDLQVATEADCKLPWSGSPQNFRCGLCGTIFKPGDQWRFIMCNDGEVMADGEKCKGGNFMTCGTCNGPTVKQRWHDLHTMMYNLKKKYHWIQWCEYK